MRTAVEAGGMRWRGGLGKVDMRQCGPLPTPEGLHAMRAQTATWRNRARASSFAVHQPGSRSPTPALQNLIRQPTHCMRSGGSACIWR